jgi:hypothetical protein
MASSTSPEPSQPPLDAKPVLRKPEFKKVEQLKPSTTGHTLTVVVLSSNTVLAKGRSVSHHLRQTRIAECVVGDDTGTIVFTARNEQGNLFFLPALVFEFFFRLRFSGFCFVAAEKSEVRRGIHCAFWIWMFILQLVLLFGLFVRLEWCAKESYRGEC